MHGGRSVLIFIHRPTANTHRVSERQLNWKQFHEKDETNLAAKTKRQSVRIRWSSTGQVNFLSLFVWRNACRLKHVLWWSFFFWYTYTTRFIDKDKVNIYSDCTMYIKKDEERQILCEWRGTWFETPGHIPCAMYCRQTHTQKTSTDDFLGHHRIIYVHMYIYHIHLKFHLSEFLHIFSSTCRFVVDFFHPSIRTLSHLTLPITMFTVSKRELKLCRNS